MPSELNLDDLEILPASNANDIEPVQGGSLLKLPAVDAIPFVGSALDIVPEKKTKLPTLGDLAKAGVSKLPVDAQRVVQGVPLLSKSLGSTLESVGDLGVATLADLGANIVSPEEGYHTENIDVALRNAPTADVIGKSPRRDLMVIDRRNPLAEVAPKPEGPTPREELPTYGDVRSAPGLLRVPASAAQGLVKSAPQIAATAAGGEILPVPLAAAGVFGSTPSGFDPKAAATAAVLPFIGKYSGEIGAAVAKRFGVDDTTALNWVKGISGTVGPAAALVAQQEAEISQLPADKQHEARINMLANIAGQIALGPMGVEFERGGAPKSTKIPVEYREITPGGPNAIQPEATQSVRSVRPQPAERGGEVPTEVRGEATRVGGSEKANEPSARPGDARPAGDEAGKQIADELGVAFESSQMGRWIFTAYDNTGKKTTSFVVREGATPDEIRAKYETVRQAYGDQEDRPRPLNPPLPQNAPKSVGDFKLKSVQQGASVRGISPEELAKKPEAEQALYRQIVEQQGRQLEYTNPKTGLTFYAPEGVTPEKLQQIHNDFIKRGAEGTKQADKFRAETDEPQVESVKALDPQSGTPLSATESLVNRLETPTPAMAGPGGTVPSDVGSKPEIAQLTDALRTMAEQSKSKPQLRRAYSLGERLAQWKDPTLKAIDGLKAAGTTAKLALTGPPKWNDFKSALGKRQLALSESVLNARDFVEKAMRAIPDALTREAISNWIDNGGDRTAILRALAETDPRYEKGYEKALSLKPDEVTVAQNIQNYFESRLQDAIDAGILEDGIENYIHRRYESDSPWKQKTVNEIRNGVFTGTPAMAKKRIFQYDYEAEKAGYKPEKDFAKRVAMYDMSLNKAIADRQMVREMMAWEMPDKMPAIAVGGMGSKVGGVGTDAAFLVRPNIRGQNAVTANGRPYLPFDHPALRKWKWVAEDANGTPILVQGSVMVHPDALREIKAVFGDSLIRKYALGRGALKISGTVKQTMLDLSGFHPVQITVHGWEHRADVPLGKWSSQITGRTFKPIDLNDPVQRALISHGLNVVDHNGYEVFSEGVSGGSGSLFHNLPYAGPVLQKYNHWLFQDYIPRLKMEMATHALERNRRAYANDLKTGKMTEDQLLHQTANEANAAFGELNYEMMGRNKTFQDTLRLGLLAPDFLEARARFAGQAGRRLVGGYGAEQLTALGLGAITMYLTARIINKMIDGEYHFEPDHAFDIVHNGRAYSLRTVQGDLIHAAFNPRSFVYTRLNPVTTRTIFEAGTGRDQFGRPRDAADQVKDFASTIVPISGRGLLNPREQKLWESFINAFGITERRATASDQIYKLAGDFKKKNNISEPGEFIYDPEKDPYRSIKLALMFETPEVAAQEIKRALEKGKTDWQHLANYFDQFGTRPFTGSKEHDRQFWNSLSSDQKKLYQDAIDERRKMRENATKAFVIYRQLGE